MNILIYIVIAVLLISLVSLLGIIFIGLRKNNFEKIVEFLVSFAVGGLLGGAFFHLLPESLESGDPAIFTYSLIGIILFFIVERLFHWRHCHSGTCEVHTFAYMSLLGDGVHNLLDGMIIAGAFLSDINLGIATTIAVALHELPQELGDFGILVFAGFTRLRALIYNFISAFTSIVGALLTFFLINIVDDLKTFLVPFAGGGFIYIALVDLIPEIHRKIESKRLFLHILIMFSGLILMFIMRLLFKHE